MNIFHNIPRIISSSGAVSLLASEVKRLGGTRVLLVTDSGLLSTGIITDIQKKLSECQLESIIFSDIPPDPPYQVSLQTTKIARDQKINCIVGVGGGSSLDIAKVTSVLMTNKIPITEMFGVDLIPYPGLPLILVPTTAGTGSEVTPIAILSDHEEKLKKGVVSSHLLPKTAILDPQLTCGLPPIMTAATGADALIHAVEAFTSKHATQWSDMFAREAITRISKHIRSAYADGQNLQARTEMLETSLLAGIAFANAGVTAVHAFAYPIGAEFHIPHGIANSIMLVPVMEFNIIGNIERFAELATMLGENTKGCTKREAAHKSISALLSITEDLQLPSKLSDYGVQDKDISELAIGVMKVTRLLSNNPRVMTLNAAEDIYRKAL